MRDLILNPSKHIVYLTNFDVNTAETILGGSRTYRYYTIIALRIFAKIAILRNKFEILGLK